MFGYRLQSVIEQTYTEPVGEVCGHMLQSVTEQTYTEPVGEVFGHMLQCYRTDIH